MSSLSREFSCPSPASRDPSVRGVTLVDGSATGGRAVRDLLPNERGDVSRGVGFVPSSVDSSGGTIEGSVAQPAEKTLSNEKSFDYNGEGEPPSPMSVGITEAEFTQQLFESGFEWEWSVETAAAIYRPESQTVTSPPSSQEGKAVREDESRVVGKSKSGDEEVVDCKAT